jgi:hypothetical protein
MPIGLLITMLFCVFSPTSEPVRQKAECFLFFKIMYLTHHELEKSLYFLLLELPQWL